MKPEYELILAIVLAIVLNYIPYIGKFFKVFNTLIHESAHALMSLFTSGEVVSINLFANAEGLATTKSRNRLSKFLITVSGYVFASVVSFVFAYFISNQGYRIILYIFLSIASINLLFWVRNRYGVIWLIVVILSIGGIFYFDSEIVEKYAAILLTAIVCIDAFVSACIVMYLSFTKPNQAGDAKNLQQLTFVPAFFWGIFFFLQASLLLLLSIHQFLELSFLF